MKFQTLAIASCLGALCQSSFADVKSLTSSELTETYIKDSTIIVTPAKKKESSQPKQLVTYTIAPGEPAKTEAEEQADQSQARDSANASTDIAEQSARQQIEQIAFVPQPTADIAPLTERQINIPQYPGFQVPEGAFNIPAMGNNLGVSSDGQQLTFSIGNIPGMTPLTNLQEIHNDTVDLTPRPGGGFDMTINIPKQ